MMPDQISVRPVRVASLPSRAKKVSVSIAISRPAPMTKTTASQVATTARSGPDLTTATKPMDARDRTRTTRAVFDVDSRISKTGTTARPNHSLRRSGAITPAASRKTVVLTMTLPMEFFSSHRPRQAPGKISSIRPI